MTDDYVALRAELERGGYREIPEIDGIAPGDRVRSYGEQYPEARHSGTATVLAVMQSGRAFRGRRDTEIIVQRDEPLAAGLSTVTNWADYHTCKIPTEETDQWPHLIPNRSWTLPPACSATVPVARSTTIRNTPAPWSS